MKPPRILHISVTAGTDPTGLIALQLARDSAARGLDVHIAYGRGDGPTDIPSTRIASALDLMIHGAATRLFDRHALVDSPSSRRLELLLDDFRPDLVHLHNIHGYYISLPRLCRALADRHIPAVMTLHDSWTLTGHCATPEQCRQFAHGCTDGCRLSAAYPATSLFHRTAANLSDKARALAAIRQLHLVAPSRHILRGIDDSHLAARPATLIYNGVDTRRFCPSDEPRQPMVLAVSRRWTDAKGLTDLVGLSRLLPESLRIVAVEEVSHRAVSGSAIDFVGPCDTDRLISLYRQAAVVVIPSHGESFSMVKAEALACGTPVACYDAGATGELLVPPCGISVAPGDIRALADAVCRLAEAPTPVQPCRDLALANFDIRRMLDRYHTLYTQLLK